MRCLTLLLLLLTGFMTACSLGSSEKGHPIPLSSDLAHGNQSETLRPIGHASEDSPAYRLSTPGGDVFALAVEECHNNLEASQIATTRRLLVGLENLRAVSQRQVPLDGHSILESHFTATLDTVPLELVCYSIHEAGCVRDLVVWTERLGESPSPFTPEVLKSVQETLLSQVANSKPSA